MKPYLSQVMVILRRIVPQAGQSKRPDGEGGLRTTLGLVGSGRKDDVQTMIAYESLKGERVGFFEVM